APSPATAVPSVNIITQLENSLKHSLSKDDLNGNGHGITVPAPVRSASLVGAGVGGVAEATECVNALASGLERVLGAVDVLKPVGAGNK
ncbi:hypothetical protein HK097_009622, partial [Rhizophlyctis rosea]